ncbi:hypothetical protein SteCoe_5263 [Stentor coeruleus]|uniref:Uncharacterized protein n=1 Tax=Stentor coeruleus TaxID=5963 RepID=A0A1R2CSV3_9CILI|nr:hypothetical protein SteCoe_5263 [Stentor coeruleus]
MKNIDIDTKLQYEEPIFSQYNILKDSIEKILQDTTCFNHKMIKQSLICSSDCFRAEEFNLEESYNCSKNCVRSLDYVDQQTQILFGRFDAAFNSCLHSCTKQRRKSDVISADSLGCYTDCFDNAKVYLQDLDDALKRLKIQFSN